MLADIVLILLVFVVVLLLLIICARLDEIVKGEERSRKILQRTSLVVDDIYIGMDEDRNQKKSDSENT